MMNVSPSNHVILSFLKKSFFILCLFFSGTIFAQDPIPPQGNLPPPNAQQNTAQQMSASQFEAWLQSNGFSQSASNNKQIVINTPPSLPAAQKYHKPSTASHRPKQPITYEESQEVMLETLPTSAPKPTPEAQIAFKQLLQQNMPLTPDQVIRLRQQIDLQQRAASVPPNIPPKPVSSTIMVNLAPGTTPPAIRLAQGYVTSLVFVDSTGQPWPIAAFDIGNPKSVNIQWDRKSNIMFIQAVTPYSDGDIVFQLVGLPTPVTFQLVAGQRVVDYRVDIHVSGIGPNTKTLPIGSTLPGSANQLLLEVLDGIAPAGSKQLTVLGGDCLAWQLGERMYFRTRMTVLSPGWFSHMTSPDGMQAYELPVTSSVLVSRFGEPTEIRIEGM